jgi:hypothetical protein
MLSYIGAFILPLFLFVCGILVLSGARRFAQTYHEKKAWPTVIGQTTGKTKMALVSSIRGAPTYYPLLEYRYQVDGKQFTSWRVYSHDTAADSNSNERLFKKYQGTVTAHYDPADPEQAFLVLNSPVWIWLLRMLGAAFLLVAAFIVFERWLLPVSL